MKTYHAESARAGLEAAADAGLAWDDFCRVAIELLDLARRDIGVGILDQVTEGQPDRSSRHRDLLIKGDLRHEMRSAYRASGVDRQHRNAAAAVIIVNDSNEVTYATDAAGARITELGGELWSKLPIPVVIVVAAARGRGERVPRIRLRSRSSEWLTLHAAQVRDPDGLTSEIAVTIEPAGAAVIPLIVAAYGLTDRERAVVQQALADASTNEIAQRLHVSPYTVQDHLKAVFEKTGVSSRRELSSRIFFDQYAGRLGSDLDANGWFA